MILKISSPKNSAKKLAFLTQNRAKLCKILIITLVFEKNANFFAQNCQKSQKIVIITSVPGDQRYENDFRQFWANKWQKKSAMVFEDQCYDQFCFKKAVNFAIFRRYNF
jgi:hypothetical protein